MAALKSSKAPPPEAGLEGSMAGEYVILRKLGAGGFGTVYEAEHPILKRRAAVKVLQPSRSLDSVAVARFIAEAQSANQIRHRHIVDIFSFGTLPGGQHFYVMDFLQGEPLDRFLDENKNLAPEVALALLRPVAQALDALHAVGVVHRDVKPPNIYLAWDSNDEVVPKLLDFGLVKLLGESPVQTASGVPMGTPYYMSPEQCRGERVDARSDVYAFGVICHELLGGSPPFTGESPAGVLVQHVLQPPPRLSEIRPDLPAELDAPVLEMLAKKPADRPASVGAAFQKLEEAARRAGIEVPKGLPHLPRPPAASLPVISPVSDTVEVGSSRARGLSSEPGSNTEPTPKSSLPVFLAWGAVAVAVALAVAVASLSKSESVASEASAPQPSSAPVAKAPEPPVAAPVPPAVPRSVSLTLRGVPGGTEVFLGDEKLGDATEPLRLPRGEAPVDITLRASGYEPKTVPVTPSRDAQLVVSLTKVKKTPRAPARKGSVPTDLENPF